VDEEKLENNSGELAFVVSALSAVSSQQPPAIAQRIDGRQPVQPTNASAGSHNRRSSGVDEIAACQASSTNFVNAYYAATSGHQHPILQGVSFMSFDGASPNSLTDTDGVTLTNDASSFSSWQHDFNIPQDTSYWSGIGAVAQNWLDFELLEPTEDFAVSKPSDSFGMCSSIYQATAPRPSLMSLAESSTNPETFSQNPSNYKQLRSASRSVTVSNKAPQLPSQQWPFAHSREAAPRQWQLPPLREILQKKLPTFGDDQTTIETLIQLLSEPFLPKIGDDLESFRILPAMHLLRRAIDAFFDRFNDILPIIHVPTWDLFKSPTVLLAAIACIGATFLDDPDAWEKSLAFSDICSQMILWLVSQPLERPTNLACQRCLARIRLSFDSRLDFC